MGLLKEFRDFAMRGNVIDLAVGVVIGFIFLLFEGVSFKQLRREAEEEEEALEN